MPDLYIGTKGIRQQLKSLNTHKAIGPDGINANILKELTDVLAESMTNLYRLAVYLIQTGSVPSDRRTAFVTPIHKVKGTNVKITDLIS